MFRFDVYDEDSASKDLTNHDFIGSVTLCLADIVTVAGQCATEKLKDRSNQPVRNQKSRIESSIIIRGEEVSMNLDVVNFKFYGEQLEKMDWCCGKSDPYLEFFRSREDGSWMSVMRTEVIMKSLNPTWQQSEYKVQTLCNGDYDRPLWMKCFDWNNQAAPSLIGEAALNLKKLTSEQGLEIPLIRQKDNDDSKTYGRYSICY
eukprot:TRINITY_DN6625_c0_g1_i1.p1 TRINITY_DN6625_c0_g1~~TRINITY_DN6625_c0_g1_i1.p1  ORF type:complete len:203 (+),score=34.04 TRINITY_DN6625_c0_g1_i1:309-917(+)